MSERVSDEKLREIVDEIRREDIAAAEHGQAHGDYGEDFGALVFDLRDARARVAALEAGLKRIRKHVCLHCDAHELARALLTDAEKEQP